MSGSNTIYEGRIVSLRIEPVTLPNGERFEMEIVSHPGGAATVALDEAGRVCLLHQYRHAVGGWLWELPAGKIDAREPPLTTAQRELAEEAGVGANHWRALGEIVSSPGVFTERVYLYLATGLRPVAARAEPHEVFEIHWLALEEAVHLAASGEYTDAKTVVGLLRTAALSPAERAPVPEQAT
ncbi:MAG TPA: NUDIX hydrolase [Gammaproteobacteria bacterium]|nr:NUDIX hydrolase [Gammaproteobacteria bacterium]